MSVIRTLTRKPGRSLRCAALSAVACLCSAAAARAQADGLLLLQGTIHNSAGEPDRNAVVLAGGTRTRTDDTGHYALRIPAGHSVIEVQVGNATVFRIALDITTDRTFDVALLEDQSVTVHARPDALQPDPATQGYSHAELLDANPGRPGVPLSIPGYPVETASGGIKAPQYFAPGVAGDHGEPIAQYLSIAGFLLPNNLTANAHGNGYADPNFLVSGIVGGVVVDGGAFNARYGDHAINLAVTYDLRPTVPTSLQAFTTGKDVAVGGTLRLGNTGWLAAEALLGNGWLARPEEREQYKLNALHTWTAGNHQVSAFGVGYYGFSRIPGLIPLDVPIPGATIDPRQKDLTHTALGTVVDQWQLAPDRSLVSGLYGRTYSLNLFSNFGDGLIRQSEFRTVAGASSTYTQRLPRQWTLLAGLEVRRDHAHNLNLHHFNETTQAFDLVSSNDLALTTVSPFGALTGQLLPGVQLYAGVRRDQVCFNNQDRLDPTHSIDTCPGVTSPKINLTFGSVRQPILPQLGFSVAKAFHANDPRIGTGDGEGQLLVSANEYQVFLAKSIVGSELRVTLGQVRSSGEFAKIDPDTGLQQDVGPSQNRFLTLQLNRRTTSRFWQLSWSQADARDRADGTPVPEAPRMIVDALIGTNRLPYGFTGKTEFEYVKAKPLGDGFTGEPLSEIRFSLSRSFQDGRWTGTADGQLLHGATGQTLETITSGPGASPDEQRTGVPVASYATVGLRYNFLR